MVSVKTIQSATVFAWFMLMMIIRRFILLLISMISGRKKPPPPGTRVPEDSMLKSKNVVPTTIDTAPMEFTKSVRANRTIGNDAENDTYFLILLFATVLYSDKVSMSSIRTIIYASIYLFARIVYALAYIFGLQPIRTLIFFVGLLCTLACNLDLVILLSRQSN